jgi:hypothetical protein
MYVVEIKNYLRNFSIKAGFPTPRVFRLRLSRRSTGRILPNWVNDGSLGRDLREFLLLLRGRD